MIAQLLLAVLGAGTLNWIVRVVGLNDSHNGWVIALRLFLAAAWGIAAAIIMASHDNNVLRRG